MYMTSNEFNPFLHYSAQLQNLLSEAAKHQNPALWLHQHKVRTVLFMLEALTRIHQKAFNEKLFSKWYKRYKRLEDIFGKIDDHFVIMSKVNEGKNVPVTLLSYLSKQTDILLNDCNRLLNRKQWLNGRQFKFDKKIMEYTVLYDKEYAGELKKAIQDEIEEIKDFCEERDYTFTLIEDEVHEIRRKLRWLSMYGQALMGLIQLKKKKVFKTKLNYLTQEILDSPYNLLPQKPEDGKVIFYDYHAFFALSYVIDALGKLKDSVLPVHMVSSVLVKTEHISLKAAEIKALKILVLKNDHELQAVTEASRLMKIFVTQDRIPDKLL